MVGSGRALAPSFALILSLLLASITTAQDAPLELGTDVAGDDAEALTAVAEPALGNGDVVPCPGDCTNIDDVLALAVAATADEVQFTVTVAERPEDSMLVMGTYCWMAAFQVQGNAEEFLALVCEDYVNGDGTPVEQDSSRGTEIASGHEWVEGAAAVLIHVPLADIGASHGTVLEDIYALTYISDNLFVDDAAPDAKSDRDADESFGTYTIGGGAGPGSGGNGNDGADGADGADGNSTGNTTTSQTNTTSTGSPSPSSSVLPTGGSTNTTTGNGTADDEQESPLPSMAWAGLAVFALAALVRRRLS